MSNKPTTNDIKYDRRDGALASYAKVLEKMLKEELKAKPKKTGTEPQMMPETDRFIMSFRQGDFGEAYYPEPSTGEQQVVLGLHVRIPDF